MPTYLFGTLGNRTLDVADICGGQPAGAVAVYPTAATVALGVLTLGIYTPLEIRVHCSKGTRGFGRRARRTP
jgi:hypothetical protein